MTRREALEQAKSHYVSAIAAVLAAAASAYGASQQASAAKKSKLAAANAAMAGGAGGGGMSGGGNTVAAQTHSATGGTLGKDLASAADFGEPGGKTIPQGRSYSDLTAGMNPVSANAVTPQPQGDVFPASAQAHSTADSPIPYSTATGLNDKGTRDTTPETTKGYVDAASSALPLILALTQGHAPQAQPLARPTPYNYVPTAMRYRQMIGGGGF